MYFLCDQYVLTISFVLKNWKTSNEQYSTRAWGFLQFTKLDLFFCFEYLAFLMTVGSELEETLCELQGLSLWNRFRIWWELGSVLLYTCRGILQHLPPALFILFVHSKDWYRAYLLIVHHLLSGTLNFATAAWWTVLYLALHIRKRFQVAVPRKRMHCCWRCPNWFR